jgi:mRNA interferase MazF
VKRGEIWWASLPDSGGSEPGFRRPVVIVQSDAFTASAIRTVIVAVLTTNLRLADAPGNVMLAKRQSRLKRDSVINVSQLLTLDKSFLTERVGRVPTREWSLLQDGLRLVLAL